jgi:hypothetical protein
MPAPAAGRWLTAMFRPAGTLDGAAAAALGRSLAEVAVTADMVLLDLDAVGVSDVPAFVEALRLPAGRLAQPGRCLLLANVPARLRQAIEAAGVPAATLPADLPRWPSPA